MALWSGRFEEGVDAFTQHFGASLPVDRKLYAQDIAGSRAHAAMLAAQGVAFFFLFLIRGYEGTNILFLSRMLPLCIYTAAAAVPAFLAVRWLHQRFQRLIYPAE